MQEVVLGINGFNLGFILFEIGGFMVVLGTVRNKFAKDTRLILRVVGLLLCVAAIVICKVYQ